MDVVSVLGRPRPQGPVGSTTVWRCPYRETLDLLWGTLYGAPVSLGGLAEAHAWVVEQVRAGALPPCADLEDDP